MNVTEIPWTQVGAFGGFTLIVLAIVLWFVFKSRKRNGSGATMNRARCINDPRVQVGITDLAISRESMTEMKGDMKMLREKSVEQTTILKNIHSQGIDQTKVLERIAGKIGRK